MSMVTSASTHPSSSIQSIVPQKTSPTLSPRHYRRHPYCHEFSDLVNAGLSQPQPLSSTITTLPQQLINCTLKHLDQSNIAMNQQIKESEPELPSKPKQTNQLMDDNSSQPTVAAKETSTPSSVDGNETPLIDRWSKDFRSLIEDPDGYNLYKEYMKEIGYEYMLKFYFAIQGLKKSEEKHRLIRVIFKHFILPTDNLLNLSNKCRDKLIDDYSKEINKTERQRNSQESSESSQESNNTTLLDENTFDEAFQEVEEKLSGAFYDNFFKSQIFINYSNNLEASKNKNIDDDSLSKQTKGFESEQEDDQDVGFNFSGNKFIMPTIDETSEDGDSTVIEVSKFQQLHINPSKQKTLNKNRERPSFKLYPNEIIDKIKYDDHPPNPYHVNPHAQYSTVQYNSKKDSEIDSSSDSSFVCLRNDRKSSLRTGRMNVVSFNNRITAPGSQRVRPQQVKQRLLAEENPEEFANQLIEKLNLVRHDQETHIKVRLAMAECDREERFLSPGTGELTGASHGQRQREAGVGQSASGNNPNSSTNPKAPQTKSSLGLALKKIDFSGFVENDQAILDKHIAQVFETSNSDSPVTGHTPNQSSSIYHPQQPYIHYNGSNAAVIDGGVSSTMSLHQLPPTSPLSPTPHIGSNFTVGNCVPIPVYVKFSTEEMPHKLTLMGPHITLMMLKQHIPCKRGIHQFYFKRRSTEAERKDVDCPYILEQISDDHVILPLCDGKIHASIEMSN